MDSRQRRVTKFRYRKIAPSSTTDESLFKSGTVSFDRGTLYITGRDTPICINPFQDWEENKTCSRNCARLSLEDIEQIKRLNEIDYSCSALRHQAVEDNLEERIAKAAELRKRMMEIDDEKRKRGTSKREPSSASPINSVISRAHEASVENKEEVREMNSIILKCKVDAIRRRQIQLKREAAEEQERLQKEMDLMMEEERLRTVKVLEARDAARLEKLRLQEEMIRQQIAERKLKRELELEERERERALILKQMEALKFEDELVRRRKEEAARKTRLEVNAHNEMILQEKKQREALELLEEEKIIKYNQEKCALEKEMEDKRRKLEAAKQKGYAAICARQDRELDKLAQRDAIRARRAMEERERLERQREAADQERQKKINSELAQARLEQQREKIRRLVEAAVAEKQEFERVAASQREIAMLEQARKDAERTRRLEHMKGLKQQIELRSLELEHLKIKQCEEAEALRLEEEENRKCIEKARERKLAELRKLTDAENYISQLRKVHCLK